MHLSTVILSLAAVASAAVVAPSTRVSPDGYVYQIDDTAHVPEIFTRDDGTTTTIYVHPAIKFRSTEEDAPGTSPNVAKRLNYAEGENPDQCGNSSFKKKTSSGSPSVNDCKAIVAYWKKKQGFWVAMSNFDLKVNGDWTRLVITGTCVFGIKSKNQRDPRVGARDISDLTQSSIDMYQSNGKVGAEGNMGCKTDMFTGTASVDWAIFHK